MNDVIVYTTSTCPYCRDVKNFLNREGIPFQEKNVERDRQAAQEMVNRTGQMGVPVTVMAGQAIIGFDQSALRQGISRLRQSGNANGLKLGANVADAVQVLARQGQPTRAGAILGTVKPGSLAARAGLKEGDVIVRLGGQAINNPNDLAQALKNLPTTNPTSSEVNFWRAGAVLNTKLPL